ncbi:E3 ubiquitin-protein ligase CHIP [Abeliophyllum distichum]|uniref:RING-type E3 ubiquitin transferase n=1 Tax=Abeliophyllum distichum TaxID=126358 RepID=A0ABD1R9D7_9LAMI
MENSIEIGNACSREKKYEEAIAQYSQAIVENPENPLIWRRRAMCYFKLSNWSEVVEDAKMVLFLDSRSVKGHFLMGSALLKMSHHEDGVLEIQKIKQVDPVSKQPLYSASQLVPNLAIKAAIVEFLEKFW